MANILFIVVAFQLLLGGLYGWFYWHSLEYSYWQGWVFIFSAPIYLILGLAVRWINYYSLLIGFVLYLYLAFTIHALPPGSHGVWQDGLFLKLPILGFLLWGLLVQDDWKQREKKWKALLTCILMTLCGFGIQFAIYRIIALNNVISNLQDGLTYFGSHLPEGNRMSDFVNHFCNVDLRVNRDLTVLGFILGTSSLGLCLLVIELAIQAIRRKKLNSMRQP